MGPLGLLLVVFQTLVFFLLGTQPLIKGFDSVHFDCLLWGGPRPHRTFPSKQHFS